MRGVGGVEGSCSSEGMDGAEGEEVIGLEGAEGEERELRRGKMVEEGLDLVRTGCSE